MTKFLSSQFNISQKYRHYKHLWEFETKQTIFRKITDHPTCYFVSSTFF